MNREIPCLHCVFRLLYEKRNWQRELPTSTWLIKFRRAPSLNFLEKSVLWLPPWAIRVGYFPWTSEPSIRFFTRCFYVSSWWVSTGKDIGTILESDVLLRIHSHPVFGNFRLSLWAASQTWLLQLPRRSYYSTQNRPRKEEIIMRCSLVVISNKKTVL